MKTCTGCSKEKPLDQFYRQGARPRAKCKDCFSEFNKAQYTKHHDKRVAYEAARGPGWARCDRAKWNPTERHKWDVYLRRTYGISGDEFDAMFERQGRVCGICKQECNRSTSTRLCVDHDHATKKVRGLLCFQCNVGLGKFGDDWTLVRRAMEYLLEAAQ